MNAKEYVALLRAGSTAIRHADPHAEVVAAGLPNSNLGVPFLTFLDRMYEAGAKGLFDDLAIHPYSHNVQGLLTLAEQARSVMDRWGDRSRLWITEFGWSTGGDASAFRVSERGQANRISEALSALIAERRVLRLRGFVFFKWKDSVAPAGSDADPWPLHTGLLNADGAPKPGFWFFGRIVQALRDGPAATTGSAELARVSRRTVPLSPLGFAAVTLGCRSDQADACAGRLELTAARPARCGNQRLSVGTPLGSKDFQIAVAPAIAPVRLRSAVRRIAECAGQIRVRPTLANPAAAQAAANQSVEFTIRAR